MSRHNHRNFLGISAWTLAARRQAEAATARRILILTQDGSGYARIDRAVRRLGWTDVFYLEGGQQAYAEHLAWGRMARPTANTKNRLVQVENSEGDILAEYYYGPFGRRLWKEVGGRRTYFFYAEEGLAVEIDASGEVQKTYGYWPGSTWSTDPHTIGSRLQAHRRP